MHINFVLPNSKRVERNTIFMKLTEIRQISILSNALNRQIESYKQLSEVFEQETETRSELLS